MDGLPLPDVASGVEDFDVAWLHDGSEVRKPLPSAAGTAFESVAPVREFPSYDGGPVDPLRGSRD